MPVFWRVLIIRGLNFVKGFFCIYWDFHTVLIFQFVNMVYHIDRFAYIEEFLYPWIIPNLIMVYELFNVLLNCICENFVEDFCICLSVILACSFLFCVIFVCVIFWYQGDGGLVEWIWKWSFPCNFLKEFYKDRH